MRTNGHEQPLCVKYTCKRRARLPGSWAFLCRLQTAGCWCSWRGRCWRSAWLAASPTRRTRACHARSPISVSVQKAHRQNRINLFTRTADPYSCNADRREGNFTRVILNWDEKIASALACSMSLITNYIFIPFNINRTANSIYLCACHWGRL